MPLTVITLKKVPPSLRGDLTKWMQEIATGVYVGNFNRKVREQLWERVVQSTATGEATMSYSHQNEIGYQFETFNTQRQVVDYDGIPLVMLVGSDADSARDNPKKGFSNASKFRKARQYSAKKGQSDIVNSNYVVVDIETDGLDYKNCQIIEIGVVKYSDGELSYFNRLIEYDKILPEVISKLTGITQNLLDNEGQALDRSLEEFIEFIGDFDIVGYGIDFDMKFLNEALKGLGMMTIPNTSYDLMRFVKKEKLFLNDYKLQTALVGYEIESDVLHRALEDAKVIYHLSTKVNKFLKMINQE